MILYQLIGQHQPFAGMVSAEDALLFRQDGVYQLLREHTWPTAQRYVLAQDLIDRQLQAPAGVQVIDDTEWVRLTLTATQVVLWSL